MAGEHSAQDSGTIEMVTEMVMDHLETEDTEMGTCKLLHLNVGKSNKPR